MSASVSTGSPRSAPCALDGRRHAPALAAELISHLRLVSPQVEDLLVARFLEIDAAANRDPEFVACVTAAARESVDLFASIIELGNSSTPCLPPAFARQTRYLARSGVPLDVVMRCYSIVPLLVRFIAKGDLSKDALSYLLEIQGPQGDRLMGGIAAEYRDELEWLERSSSGHLAEVVEKLLAGESADTTALDYELDESHLGLIAVSFDPQPLLDAMARRHGCRILAVPRGADTSWIWLGGDLAASPEELESFIPVSGDAVSLAVGEPRAGIEGWRQTHREAKTALGVNFGPQRLLRCADVVLPAALSRNQEIHRFFLDAYLRPLARQRDADLMRKTLRTYMDHGCNATSTATSLGVDRHTIQRRLRRAEEILGRRVDACRSELEVALHLEQLGEGTARS